MSVWGHYEKMSVQGSKRKAKIFIPSLLHSALPPFVFFVMPIAAMLSTSDKGRSLLYSPWSIALGVFFFLFFFAVGLMGVWAGICEQRDARRMRNGELVLRSGELFILSRTSTTRYRHGYRFAIRNQQGRGEVEIYEMPEKLYQQFSARCWGGTYHARSLREESRLFYGLQPRVYQVDLVVLPPEKGPAFRLVELSDHMRRIAGEGSSKNDGKYPVFTGTVADILYKEGRFDTFYVKDDVLFER